MKRTLAIIFAAVLCVTAVAYAQPAEDIELETYESEHGYSIDLPEGWFKLDDESFQKMVDAVGEEKIAQLGLSEESLSTINQLGMEMFIAGDYLSNINIIATPASGATLAMFPALEEVIKQQLEATSATDIAFLGAVTAGTNDYYAVTYVLTGATGWQYYSVIDDVMYTITCTSASDEDVAVVLESFAVLQA